MNTLRTPQAVETTALVETTTISVFIFSVIVKPGIVLPHNTPCPSPWGVFETCVENMRGVERGLDWVLHHLAKKRRDWTYHTSQGKS